MGGEVRGGRGQDGLQLLPSGRVLSTLAPLVSTSTLNHSTKSEQNVHTHI